MHIFKTKCIHLYASTSDTTSDAARQDTCSIVRISFLVFICAKQQRTNALSRGTWINNGAVALCFLCWSQQQWTSFISAANGVQSTFKSLLRLHFSTHTQVASSQPQNMGCRAWQTALSLVFFLTENGHPHQNFYSFSIVFSFHSYIPRRTANIAKKASLAPSSTSEIRSNSVFMEQTCPQMHQRHGMTTRVGSEKQKVQAPTKIAVKIETFLGITHTRQLFRQNQNVQHRKPYKF